MVLGSCSGDGGKPGGDADTRQDENARRESELP
jgi:hypothetical protein